MSISVYTHIHPGTEVSVTLQEGEVGKYAALSAGRLSVFINNREKALEIASMLERAAQEWEEDILGWELQIDAPNHTTPYTAPKPVEQQSIKSDLARDAADHLTNWLEMDICECEDGHYCGYNEVKRTRDALLEAAEQQPSPDVSGLAEALEGILPYVVDEPWECRGDKCRELWCISCFGDDEACESAAKAKQAIHKAVSALAVYRNQGGDK